MRTSLLIGSTLLALTFVPGVSSANNLSPSTVKLISQKNNSDLRKIANRIIGRSYRAIHTSKEVFEKSKDAHEHLVIKDNRLTLAGRDLEEEMTSSKLLLGASYENETAMNPQLVSKTAMEGFRDTLGIAANTYRNGGVEEKSIHVQLTSVKPLLDEIISNHGTIHDHHEAFTQYFRYAGDDVLREGTPKRDDAISHSLEIAQKAEENVDKLHEVLHKAGLVDSKEKILQEIAKDPR